MACCNTKVDREISYSKKIQKPEELAFLLAGADKNRRRTSIIQCYNFQQNEWTCSDETDLSMVTSLASKGRAGHGACLANNCIFLCGGFELGVGRQASTLIFELATRKWKEGPQMTTLRSAHAQVLYKETIYVFGGWKKLRVEVLNSCESLSTRPGSLWKTIHPMASERAVFSAVCFQDKIVVIGGSSDSQWSKATALASCEFFEPSSGNWSAFASLNISRCCHSSKDLGDRIFVVGGCNTTNKALNSAEMYDAITKKWTLISDLNVPRKLACLLVHDGCLYIFGGQDISNSVLGSLEKFDPVNRKWQLEKIEMKIPICWSAGIVCSL